MPWLRWFRLGSGMLAWSGLLLAPAWATGLLSPMGPVAAEQQTHLWRVVAITAIAVLPVIFGVPLIAWRYARRRRGTYRPDFAYSGPLEIAMWGVPAVLVVILGFWLWQSASRYDPYQPLGPDPLDVDVVGLSWKWVFLYPEQRIATVGSLVLPVGRPVRLRLTTDTVMQSFMIPELAGQIYAMPGMVTEQNLVADRAGVMEGLNTQFNGDGFAGQTVRVQTMAENDWEDWLKAHDSAPTLDAAAYAQLAAAGTLDDARRQFGIGEGDVVLQLGDPELFETVVHRYHGGQPVDAQQQPGSSQYRAGAKP